jgi:hypothetical protein
MAQFEAGEKIPDVRKHLRRNPIQKFIKQAFDMLLFRTDSKEAE